MSLWNSDMPSIKHLLLLNHSGYRQTESISMMGNISARKVRQSQIVICRYQGVVVSNSKVCIKPTKNTAWPLCAFKIHVHSTIWNMTLFFTPVVISHFVVLWLTLRTTMHSASWPGSNPRQVQIFSLSFMLAFWRVVLSYHTLLTSWWLDHFMVIFSNAIG